MKTITRWIPVFLALILALSAAGCGGGEQQAGPVTIHVLAMEQAGATVEEMNSIVKEFNEKNPNVSVQIDYVAYDALHDKIVMERTYNASPARVFAAWESVEASGGATALGSAPRTPESFTTSAPPFGTGTVL